MASEDRKNTKIKTNHQLKMKIRCLGNVRGNFYGAVAFNLSIKCRTVERWIPETQVTATFNKCHKIFIEN